jgi:heme/copper-type cytochrome/quinol oxidase subunit 2
MAAKYVVEDQKDFDAWYKGQLEYTQGYLKKQAEELAKAAAAKPAPAHGAPKAH